MPGYQWLEIGLRALWVFFVFAWGACLGSLINVLVYRLPLGMGVVTDASRCPACQTKLTWRENIPVLGWVFLRGRCRFCKSRISAEYPLVELLVGLLWVALYLLWYVVPHSYHVLGFDLGAIRPEWARVDAIEGWPRTTWPVFVAFLLLIASLVAMTLTDLKTFTIPLVLPWFATIIGIAFHTLGGVIQHQGLRSVTPGWAWAIPTPGGSNPTTPAAWWWIGAAFGAVFGLVLANLLLHFKLIRRSFDDYAEWEKATYPQLAIEASAQTTEAKPERPGEYLVGEHAGDGVGAVIRFTLIWIASIIILGALGHFAGARMGVPTWSGLAAGAVVGPLLAAAILRGRTLPHVVTAQAAASPGEPSADVPADPEMWIAYPHARREMLKELIFLTPCIALALLGGMIGQRFAGHTPPLWLLALVGSLMGYLIGGAVVWAIRIAGSLGFGKEAMGLGDVHLMAAVGAVAGWITASLAVPLAAGVGLFWFIVAMVMNRPAGRAMPFGPYLAIASVLVILGRPAIELGLNWLLATDAETGRLFLP